MLTRPRVRELLSETKEKTGIAADASIEALIAAMNHLKFTKLAIGSRWADPVNDAIKRYLEAGGIEVVGTTKRNQWASDSFAMSLEQGLEMALDVGREAARTWPEAEAISVREARPCRCTLYPRSKRVRQAGVHQHERRSVERSRAPKDDSAGSRMGPINRRFGKVDRRRAAGVHPPGRLLSLSCA